jgi:hypothetical protein
LAVLIEHELEPLFFLLSILIDFFLDFVHLVDDGGVFGEFVGLVEEVEAQFDVLALAVDELEVGLGFLVVALCGLFHFQCLLCGVHCVIFFVHFGQAGANVEIQCHQMSAVLLVVFLPVLGK